MLAVAVASVALGCGGATPSKAVDAPTPSTQPSVERVQPEPEPKRPDPDLQASTELLNAALELVAQQQYAAAEQKLGEAVRIAPHNHGAWYALGLLRALDKRWGAAAQALAHAVHHQPDDPTYRYKLGQALYTDGDPNAAVEHLAAAVELDSAHGRAHYFLGLAERDRGRPRPAALALTRACDIEPELGLAFIALAKLYLQWEYTDRALRVLQVGADHVRKPVWLVDIHYYAGLVHDARSEPQQAIAAYTRALAVGPDVVEALLQRGLLYAAAGDRDKAREDLEEYLRQASGRPLEAEVAREALKKLESP